MSLRNHQNGRQEASILINIFAKIKGNSKLEDEEPK